VKLDEDRGSMRAAEFGPHRQRASSHSPYYAKKHRDLFQSSVPIRLTTSRRHDARKVIEEIAGTNIEISTVRSSQCLLKQLLAHCHIRLRREIGKTCEIINGISASGPGAASQP